VIIYLGTLDEDMVGRVNEQVDEALGMMLSLDSTPEDERKVGERVQLAISTALKMLTNLEKNILDVKLKSIRVNNAAFYAKVSGIPGGKELFVCSGFILVNEGEEEFLKYPEEASLEGIQVLRHVINR
jgi:hypothetical protein